MAGLNFDITANNSDFLKKTEEIKKGIREAARIIEEEGKRLEAFDSEVLKMCTNLNKYFDSLLDKIEAMASTLQIGKVELSAPSVKSDGSSVQQLNELRSKNAELTAELEKQREEIRLQQEEWNKLATAIKSNNMSAIKQYKQATNSSSDSVKKAKMELKDLTKDLNENIKYYDKLALQISSYNSILDRLYTAKDKGLTRVQIGDGATALISSELERFKPQLDDVIQKSKEIASQISEQRKRQTELNAVIEQGNEKHLRTRTLIMDVREQLIQMRASGMQNTVQYQQAGEELGKMRLQMKLVNAEMEFLANPNKGLAALKAGLSGAATSASLVVGVMGLFNDKSEKMAELQTKIQSLMGIVVGLEGAYGMLKKSNTVMLAIENVRRKAIIASMALENKAKTTNIALTWSEVAAQKALNLVAKQHPYVLLATAILTVVGGVWLLIDASKKARKELKEFNKSVAETAVTPIAKVEELSMKWNRLGDNLVAKKKFVEDNKKAFNDLSISILDVVDAENLLNNNKDAFIKAMIERAKATQYIKQQEDNIKALVEAERNIEATRNLQFEDFSSGGIYISAEERKKTAVAAAQYRYDEIAKKIKDGYTLAAKSEEEGAKILDNARIKSTENAENLVDDYTYKMMTGLDRGRNNFDSFAKNLSKGYNSLLDKMQDSTTTFSQKISTLFSTLFSSDKIIEEGRLTIGERITKLQTDYTAAQNKLKGLRKTSSKASQQEINDAEKEVNKIAGIYKSLTGKEIKNPKEYNSIVDQQKKISELLDKQALERRRRVEDLENQNTQSYIDTIAESADKIRRQRELDNKKEIQDLERQREDYIRTEIELQRKVFDEQENLRAKQIKDYKKKTFDPSTVKVDTSAFDSIIGNINKRQFSDQIRKQEQDWDEYIIKYGTFQQKKEAITRKYNKTIEEALTAGEAAFLQKEFEEALSNLDLSKLKQDINWEMIFGDLSKVTKDQLTKIKKQLQEFKNSSEFQKATPEQVQVIEGAFNSINNALVDKGGFFGGMADSLRELKDATEELKKAEEELVKANKSGSEAQKEEARKKVNKAQQRQQNAETNVTKSGDKTIQHLTDVGNAIAQLGSSAEMNLSSFGNAAGSIVDAFTEAGDKMGGLVGAIFSILDGIQQQGIDKFVGNILESVAGAALNVVTFGLVKLGADYSHYDEMRSQYESLNDIWDELIDKKKEYIDISYGPEAAKVGEEAIEIANKSIESYKLLGKERLNSGASAGSHSIGVRVRNNMSQNEWDQWNNFAKSIGKNPDDVGGRMTGLFDLTADQLEKLKEDAPAFWAKLDGDVQDYLNKIIEGEERIEDIQKQVQEQLTQTTFDSVYDNFVDTLMDMKADASDFSDDLSEMFMRSLLSNEIGTQYYEKLKGWYVKWSEAMKIENEVGRKLELDSLRQEYEGYVDSAIQERNDLANTVGYTGNESTSQSSSQKGFTTMSQDTGEELNGRFTALQISNEEIKDSMLSMLVSMNLISVTVGNNSITLTEIRNLAISSNSYLEDIAGYQKRIVNDFGNKLDSINSGIKQFNSK